MASASLRDAVLGICRKRVIHVISSVRKRLPLFTQVQTFRRVALSDVTGQYRKWTKDHAYP